MAPLLELTDVRAGYGRVEVLRGLDLTVPEGSVVALLGPNGVGKTTTLRAIGGTLELAGGSISLAGERIDGLTPDAIARNGVVLVPEGRGVFPGMPVSENLRVAHTGAVWRDRAPAWDSWLEEITTTFPRLGERLDQRAGSLSGGEQQMLALCRALAGDPRLIMVDELSMGLAPMVVEDLLDHVARLRAAGRTILLVEQYLSHALELADICYVLARGRVRWAGEPSELRGGDTLARILSTG